MATKKIPFQGFDTIPDIYPPRNDKGEYSGAKWKQWFNVSLFNTNIEKVLESNGFTNIKPVYCPYGWIEISTIKDWDNAEFAVHQRIIAKFPELDTTQQLYDQIYGIAFNLIKQTQVK